MTDDQKYIQEDSLLDLYMRSKDPAERAAYQIVRGGRPGMSVDEAMEMIKTIVRTAIDDDRIANELAKQDECELFTKKSRVSRDCVSNGHYMCSECLRREKGGTK